MFFSRQSEKRSAWPLGHGLQADLHNGDPNEETLELLAGWRDGSRELRQLAIYHVTIAPAAGPILQMDDPRLPPREEWVARIANRAEVEELELLLALRDTSPRPQRENIERRFIARLHSYCLSAYDRPSTEAFAFGRTEHCQAIQLGKWWYVVNIADTADWFCPTPLSATDPSHRTYTDAITHMLLCECECLAAMQLSLVGTQDVVDRRKACTRLQRMTGRELDRLGLMIDRVSSDDNLHPQLRDDQLSYINRVQHELEEFVEDLAAALQRR